MSLEYDGLYIPFDVRFVVIMYFCDEYLHLLIDNGGH